MSGLATVDYAALAWEADGTPRSLQFDDIYFSRDGGLAESTYVYLHGNELPARWPTHFAQHDAFQLFEAGFGTGLNFLLTLRAFLAESPLRAENPLFSANKRAGKRLRYVAVEQFPLRHTDLQRALSAFPELAPFAAELLAQYPVALRGWHSLCFANQQVELLLIFDDIANTLPALRQSDWRFDAWYLDGFAPARNAGMWAEALWPAIATLSRAGATASTFSAAGAVRRGLQSAGFAVEKTAGFGRKRDMTRARFVAPISVSISTPISTTVTTTTLPPGSASHNVVVVGAGIAGAAAARALAERGLQVTVLESGDAPGGTLHSHDTALASPRWSRDHNVCSRFQLAGFLQLQRWAEQLSAESPQPLILQRDVLTLLDADQCEREQQVLTELGLMGEWVEWLDADAASAAAGIPLSCQAVRHRLALAVAPSALCQALLNHANIQLHVGITLTRFDAGEQAVSLLLQDGRQWHADALVMATGCDSRRWFPHWPLRPVRGQSTLLAATAQSDKLKLPLRFGGYLTPAHHGRHTLGATYDGGVFDPAIRAQSQQQNLAALARQLPTLADVWQQAPLQGDVGHRLVMPDRAPLVGAHPLQPRLWLTLAHGSHALMTACAAGQLLAAQMTGAPAPFPADLLRAVSPARVVDHFTAS